MECIEINLLKCPKCHRVLKPSLTGGVLQITEYEHRIAKSMERHDILICRYCNIYIKVEVLRAQKDPIEFLEQFTKIPENTEIKAEEIYKIRLRESEKENLKKYKYEVVPDKCLECDSEDIVADSQDNSWVCLSCDSYFELRNYRIMFHGDIEVFARDHDEAIEKGYEQLRKRNVDIEADWM